jgi:hypothetical protein
MGRTKTPNFLWDFVVNVPLLSIIGCLDLCHHYMVGLPMKFLPVAL